MQKFTIFSLLLSISIVLIMGDIFAHDYLSADVYLNSTNGKGTVVQQNEQNVDLSNTQPEIPDPDQPIIELPEEAQLSDEPVSLSSIDLVPEIGLEDLRIAGFLDPVLKDADFRGRIFQLIDVSDQIDATVYQSNFFDGVRFVGTIYEMKYPSDTGSFQAYLKIRERAMGLPEYGTVNEANNYGDSSFYFNHNVKTKTVHAIIKQGNSIYAFEYDYAYHEAMKKLFALI